VVHRERQDPDGKRLLKKCLVKTEGGKEIRKGFLARPQRK
jgi:hypothetical protein